MKSTDLTQMLTPIVASLGLECVGVEYSPSFGSSLLRVYIDAPGRGVTLEDCESASREISATLDVNDPVEGNYTLEVSSPGLDRPLFTVAHFAQFIGRKAKLTLSLPLDGRRRFQGAILGVEGAEIAMEQDGVPVRIAHGNIEKARLVPEFAQAAEKAARGDKRPAKPSGKKRVK